MTTLILLGEKWKEVREDMWEWLGRKQNTQVLLSVWMHRLEKMGNDFSISSLDVIKVNAIYWCKYGRKGRFGEKLVKPKGCEWGLTEAREAIEKRGNGKTRKAKRSRLSIAQKQYPMPLELGFPGGAGGKEDTCWCRRCKFDPWVGKIPWSRKWQLTPVFLPGKFHGQRSLADYSHGTTKSWAWLSDWALPPASGAMWFYLIANRTSEWCRFLSLCLLPKQIPALDLWSQWA